MFGFFKKLLGKERERAAERVVLPMAALARTGATIPPPFSQDIPAPRAIQPAAEGNVSLPLKPIVQNLPKVLQDLVIHQPANEAHIELPLRFILPQLARGSVQIAFGDLKQLSPPTTFSPSIRYDQEWVVIPLQLVIPLVPMDAITRRSDQKVVHIPDEIIVVFGGPRHAVSGKSKGHAVSSPIAVQSSDVPMEESAGATPARPEASPATVPHRPGPKPMPPLPQAPRLPKSPFQPSIPTMPRSLPGMVTPGANYVQTQPAAPLNPQPGPTSASPMPSELGPIWMPPAGKPQPFLSGAQPSSPPPARIPSTISFEPKPIPHTPPLGPLPGTMPPTAPFIPPPASIAPTPALPGTGAPIPFGGVPPPSPVTMPPRLATPSGMPPQPAIPRPIPATQPSEKAQPPAPVSAPVPEMAQEPGVLAIPLSAVSSSWPDPIKAEINQLNLSQGTITIPCEQADQPIKQGKLAFYWKQMRSWIRPATPAGFESPQDDQLLELPLPVVVPLYFAQRKPVRSGKLMSVPDVPDLFARPVVAAPASATATAAQTPSVAPAPTPAYAATPAAPVATTAPAPAPQTHLGTPAGVPITPVSGQQVADISEVFRQPGKRHWTPAEIAQKTAALPGVSGSLIAMQDGLLVASQMPSNLNGEMIAAFLPQMFGRMSHYTSELKLGEPSSVLLVVNHMPLQINRVGRVFYTVLGKPGEPLPGPAIAAVVVQLDLQSKQI